MQVQERLTDDCIFFAKLKLPPSIIGGQVFERKASRWVKLKREAPLPKKGGDQPKEAELSQAAAGQLARTRTHTCHELRCSRP